MSDTPRILVESTCGIIVEHARDARARAWVFIFRCWHEKQRSHARTEISGPPHSDVVAMKKARKRDGPETKPREDYT